MSLDEKTFEMENKLKTYGKPTDEETAFINTWFVTDRKATIANLTVHLDNDCFMATGSSWRTSGDFYDKRTGKLVALSRAVDELNDVLKKEVAKIH